MEISTSQMVTSMVDTGGLYNGDTSIIAEIRQDVEADIRYTMEDTHEQPNLSISTSTSEGMERFEEYQQQKTTIDTNTQGDD
jgi:hypothetical protein